MQKGLYQCPGCQQWWVWQCKDDTVHLQRKCRKCGHKVRAMGKRVYWGRGRPRGWALLHRPSHMPEDALIAECRTRNRKIRAQQRRGH